EYIAKAAQTQVRADSSSSINDSEHVKHGIKYEVDALKSSSTQ
ncbi:18752_t:CDS:2, partial [Dentiscutata erythropus]